MGAWREVHFIQRPSAKSLERYVTGLLMEHPVKNCDTLAQVIPATSEQRLQYLLTGPPARRAAPPYRALYRRPAIARSSETGGYATGRTDVTSGIACTPDRALATSSSARPASGGEMIVAVSWPCFTHASPVDGTPSTPV
jgi:hypothetical protein